MDGWIKLHRSLLDWEWFSDSNTLGVYVLCLLMANHKEKMWRGILISPGSFISSPEKIGERIGISRQQVRTSLTKLIKSKNITTKSTNKYTIISIINWDKHQQDNQQITNKQPTNNQQITTTKNDKKERMKEERETALSKYSSVSSIDKEVLKQVSDDLMVEYWFVEQKWESLKDWLVAKGKVYKDYKALLRNAVRKDAEDKHKKKTKTDVSSSDWDELARKAGYKL